MNNLVRVTKVIDPKQVMGVIEWKSHNYPDKHYKAQCFSAEMYMDVWILVNSISDYHTIVYHTYLKN
jgi:hypothetical protein